MRRNTKFLGLLMAGMMGVLAACGNASGEAEYPNGNIEIVAPATPGGGWDTTARGIQNTLDENGLVEENMNVSNKPGGGGEVGWQYLAQQDSHAISINSSLLLTNNLLGQSELTHEDFTPLATLATEWISVAVPADSDIENGIDMLDRLKEDPTSLNIAVGPALGNNDHLSFVSVADEYGVDVSQLEFMIYESGGDVLTALLGGHVDVATMALSESLEQHLNGEIEIIATTADKPIPEDESIPSWQDQGIDYTFPHWRGIMGPADMTDEEIAYWNDTFSQMVETEEWGTLLENQGWDDFYLDHEGSVEFLEEQDQMYEELLDTAGMTE